MTWNESLREREADLIEDLAYYRRVWGISIFLMVLGVGMIIAGSMGFLGIGLTLILLGSPLTLASTISPFAICDNRFKRNPRVELRKVQRKIKLEEDRQMEEKMKELFNG